MSFSHLINYPNGSNFPKIQWNQFIFYIQFFFVFWLFIVFEIKTCGWLGIVEIISLNNMCPYEQQLHESMINVHDITSIAKTGYIWRIRRMVLAFQYRSRLYFIDKTMAGVWTGIKYVYFFFVGLFCCLLEKWKNVNSTNIIKKHQ